MKGIDSLDNPHVLTFLVRTHAGFTRKITSYHAAEREYMATAWIDGPYGGIRRPLERLYDHLILVAGGSGISACLRWVIHCTSLASIAIRVKRVTLMWVMKRYEHLNWAEKELQAASIMNANNVVLDIKLFITDEPGVVGTLGTKNASEKTPELEVMPHKSAVLDRLPDFGDVCYRRPVIADAIKDMVSETSTVVFGCGPASMRKDIANACAKMQCRIIKGEMRALAMYQEEFGW